MDPCLQKLQDEMAALIATVTAERLYWHPPGKWCAAEIFEHLYLSYTGTIRGMERVAAADKPMATAPSWRQRGRTWLVVGMGYFPSGRQSPAVARPRGMPSDKIRAEIAAKIAEMDEIIRRCEEKHGNRTKLLDHPIMGPLTGGEWRKLHLLHGRHHGKQIRRLAAVQMK